MTRLKSFKRVVRARMEKTGESYTAARAMLLAAEAPKASEGPSLSVSDAVIRDRTGRGWEEWFDLLDEWGAPERDNKEIRGWVAEEHGVDSWGSQAVTINYARARGLRAVGEHADGFTITASKTVAVPVERLFDAFVDESLRRRWLPEGGLTERTASKPVGPLRLERGRHPRQGLLRGQGGGEVERRAAARAPGRRRGGRADEGLLARAGHDAEGGAGAMNTVSSHITQIGRVTVPVSDQDRALEFYLDKLGFEKRVDGEWGEGRRWVEFGPPEAATTLALVPPDEGESTGIDTRVSFSTDDAEAAYASLRAQGVDVDEEIMCFGGGVPPMFFIRDPDGNKFVVVER